MKESNIGIIIRLIQCSRILFVLISPTWLYAVPTTRVIFTIIISFQNDKMIIMNLFCLGTLMSQFVTKRL